MQIKTFVYREKKGTYWLGSEAMDDHIQRMMNGGWTMMNSADHTGHVRVGKTLLLAAVTSGISLLFGASRTPATLTLTFQKPEEPPLHCSACGAFVPPDATFCGNCGAPATNGPMSAEVTLIRDHRAHTIALPRSVSSYTHGDAVPVSKGHGLVAFGIFVMVCAAISVGWEAADSSEPVATPSLPKTRVTPIMDLPSLTLRRRVEVEQVLGRPSKYIRRQSQGELGDEADYPWGLAGYNQSHLNFLILRLQTKPKNFEEAFVVLGLPTPNPPFVAKGGAGETQPVWQDHPFKTGYTCCSDLAFQSIWISSDWKEMHILILDLDAPEEWSRQQCTMYVRRTGLPLPKDAVFRGDPLQWRIRSKNN